MKIDEHHEMRETMESMILQRTGKTTLAHCLEPTLIETVMRPKQSTRKLSPTDNHDSPKADEHVKKREDDECLTTKLERKANQK